MTYQPVYFDERWILQKYQGWSQVADAPLIRVLQKSFGIVKRHLVLSEGACDDAIADAVSACGGFAPSSEVVLHDFLANDVTQRTIGGVTFALVADRDRLLNNATFVVDLSNSAEGLLLGMRKSFQQGIRSAVAQGITVTFAEDPESNLVRDFVAKHNAMTRSRNLSTLRGADVATMLRDGSALIGIASLDGEPRSYAMIYLSGLTGFYLHGVSVGPKGDESGKYLHFLLMNHLQARGFKWYDLGGVPTANESNGIYLFKKGFGGEFISLGSEFAHRPPLVRGAHAAARARRRLRARFAA